MTNKKCAYCDLNEDKITREHVVNKSFIDKYYKVGEGYSRSLDKYTENYLTVKDVCAKCNNGILSILDEYFLDFYEKNIPKTVINSTSTVEIEYDFDKLSRWILKTLYNIERKGTYEVLPQKMYRTKSYILGKDKKTKLFKIYLELLQDIPKEEIIRHSLVTEDEIPDKLQFLRIGNIVFSEQLKTSIKNTIKHITSSNFMFHVFILDVGQHNESAFKSTFEKYLDLSKTRKLFFINPQKNTLKLQASNRTIIDILLNTFEGDKHVTERMKEQTLRKRNIPNTKLL